MKAKKVKTVFKLHFQRISQIIQARLAYEKDSIIISHVIATGRIKKCTQLADTN